MVYLPFLLQGVWDNWHFTTRVNVYLKQSLVLSWILKKERYCTKYKRDILHVFFCWLPGIQDWWPLPPPPPHPPTHHIQASPFIMHANEYALSLFCLRATGPASAENSTWLLRPSQRFSGTKDHAHFRLGNTGKCLRVQTNLWEQGTWKFWKLLLGK